jgi:hypothetical protein
LSWRCVADGAWSAGYESCTGRLRYASRKLGARNAVDPESRIAWRGVGLMTIDPRGEPTMLSRYGS